MADVAAALTSVISYSEQLTTVFHNYILVTVFTPVSVEDTISTLNTTVTTLKQVLSLLKDQAGVSDVSKGRSSVFNEDGLKYVHLLALEAAKALAAIEPIVEEGCLTRKERKGLLKKRRKNSHKKSTKVPDISSLKLDEQKFLETVEATTWNSVAFELRGKTERLYDLQLHLLLVHQVATVGLLSQDA